MTRKTWKRADVLGLCRAMTEAQRRAVVNLLGVRDKEDVSAGEALVMWTADLLASMAVCDVDKQAVLLDEFHGVIAEMGDNVESSLGHADNNTKLPPIYLSFRDRRYVTAGNADFILDLDDGERLLETNFSFLEAVTYDLTTLFTRNYRIMEDSGEHAVYDKTGGRTQDAG